MFVASDIPAILAHTRDVVILEDDEVAVVTRRRGRDRPRSTASPCSATPVRILWDPIMAEKGGYRHFMLKEIYEQPRAITDTFRGRIAPETGNVVLPDVEPRSRRRCARHPARGPRRVRHRLPRRHARPLHDRAARRACPAEVDLGSEFRYRDAMVGPGDAGGRGLAVGRDRGHPRRGQGGAGRKGVPDPRHHQRRRLGARPRGHRRALHARRPRDRRGVDQGVHRR